MNTERNSTEQWADWLRYKSHLRGLNLEECRLIGGMLHPVHVNEGELLFEQGESNQELFLIKNGCVKVGQSTKRHQWIDLGPYGEVDMDDDEDKELQEKVILGPGDCVGETTLFSNHAHALTAIAIEEGDMLRLDVCKMPVICSGNRHVAQCFSELLTRSLREMHGK
jgi:CRP-like cAMP-binding protein